jgi:hypothetical protein
MKNSYAVLVLLHVDGQTDMAKLRATFFLWFFIVNVEEIKNALWMYLSHSSFLPVAC